MAGSEESVGRLGGLTAERLGVFGAETEAVTPGGAMTVPTPLPEGGVPGET